MISVHLAFPLAAGLIAAFNPCGFAMLPAYLSYFLGIETESGNNKFLSILNGLKVSLALSLGFVFVFATLGILTNTIISEGSIESRAGYITLAIGILLIILGLSMIRGFHPVINIPRFNITGINRQLASMFLFGVSYAFVSVGCSCISYNSCICHLYHLKVLPCWQFRPYLVACFLVILQVLLNLDLV